MLDSSFVLTPLGGTGEIGKNCHVLEYQNTRILIDCGVAFPDSSMHGVDLVIPDFSYITDEPEKLSAVIFTHGHEDHIGSIPFLLSEIIAYNNVPIYGTALTLGLIRAKLQEWEFPREPNLYQIKPGDAIRIGNLIVKSYGVTHSIPDAVSYSFHTPDKKVVFWSGDFKFDQSPIDGKLTDYARLTELGNQGVLFASIDVTYIDKLGKCPPDTSVYPGIKNVFRNYPGRIFTTCFASNIHRVQQILEISQETGRKVLLAGRTMIRNVEIAKQLGYIKIPDNILIELEELDRLPTDKISILLTGSQGEPQAALSKIAKKRHPIKIIPGDRIIFSASPIPGNESEIYDIVNDLYLQGANVIIGEEYKVHAHGHAFQDEIYQMISMIKPKYIYPQHGEIRHQNYFIQFMQEKNLQIPITVGSNGNQYEISENGVRVIGKVNAGAVYLNIDNEKICVISNDIISQRKRLADEGVISVSLVLSPDGNLLMSTPLIRTLGILNEQDYSELFERIAKHIEEALRNNRARSKEQQAQLRNSLENSIQRFIDKEVGIAPSVLVAINYIEPKRTYGRDSFECL